MKKTNLLHYEIHITVEKPNDLEYFKSVCYFLNVKPIVLDLENQNGVHVMDDIMTSSKIYCDDPFPEMKRISDGLSSSGFTVVREKIEAEYFHTKAPFRSCGDSEMPKNCYFECHLGIKANKNNLDELKNIAKEFDAHLSKNVFKKLDDGFVIMLTYRTYN